MSGHGSPVAGHLLPERTLVGDWYMGPDPENPGRLKWLYDRDAPTPSVEHTMALPVVRPDPEPDEFAEVYEREDGSIYGRVDPAEFAPYDEVDSRTISDPGAPR